MHGQIAFLGYYEKNLSETVARVAREVGANIGYYSLLWVAQSPENEAIAVEPSPRVQPPLRRNVQRNGFEKQIEIVEAAAGRERGEVQFDLGPEEEVGWGGVMKEKDNAVTKDSQGAVCVPQRRLDEIVEGSVSLLKVDVEGAETWVFQGAEELLKSQKVERICFENNLVRARRLGIEEEEPMQVLRQYGYEVTERDYTLWAEPRD